MAIEKIETQIREIIEENGWLDRTETVRFLASGEYNENYLVEGIAATGPGKFVFRINHGSQINQTDQIRYEYNVLKAAAPSRVTPIPFHVASHTTLGGVLLMEYIPGRRFDFSRDLAKVPPIFAAVHSVPLPCSDLLDGPELICQKDPVADIATESRGLLDRFPDHPLKKEGKLLDQYHARVVELGNMHAGLFGDEPLCLVNTEVNSGNFIVQEAGGKLVDWEKAVISCRYQDLAHFLVPTTTLWKSDFRFTPESRQAFLRAYYQLIRPEFEFDALEFKTAILERTILLRAMSWCYMAWYEYSGHQRTLADPVTFNKIKYYLDNLACFLT